MTTEIMSKSNMYLRNFQTFTDPNTPDQIKIYYRIEYFNHLQLNKLVEAPKVDSKASGNFTLVYELKPLSTLPTGTTVTEEFVDGFLTGDWHNFTQPHKVTLVLVHDKGYDEGSMNTTDPQ